MKKITCEMCGSNNIIKKDGVFVCEYCGCKYTVDDAKKLMAEFVINVNDKNSYKNLLNRGKTFLELKEYDKAYSVFSEFVDTYPDKSVGYKYLILTLSCNFTNESPRVSEISDLRDKMIKVADEDNEIEMSDKFVKKVDKYCQWVELLMQHLQKTIILDGVDRKIMQSNRRIDAEKKTGIYEIIAAGMVVAFGIYTSVSFILVICIIFGIFELIVGLINLSSSNSQEIERYNKEAEQLKKELAEIEQELKNYDFK